MTHHWDKVKIRARAIVHKLKSGMPAIRSHETVVKLEGTSINWRRYLYRDFEHIGWQHYRISNPSGQVAVRSMLSAYELALLRAVAQDHYQGWGEIIDGGPLLGAGTNMLAKGLVANSQVKDKTKRIFSFDLFLRDEMGDTVSDVPDRTNSVFEQFMNVNRDYLEQIYISPGDLLRHRWRGAPVEILFIDIAKSWDLNQWVLENWFSCLRPGSIVIQQDYVYFHQYWIHITMEVFAEYLRPIDVVYGASRVYVCEKQIPAELLVRRLKDIPLVEQLRYYDSAIENAPPSVAEVLKCAEAYCLLEHGAVDEAERFLNTVRTDQVNPDHAQDFSEIARSNQQMVGRLIQSVRTAARDFAV